jgi:hypothetical protein
MQYLRSVHFFDPETTFFVQFFTSQVVTWGLHGQGEVCQPYGRRSRSTSHGDLNWYAFGVI